MGLGNIFRGQLIDVIEWLDNTNDTMVYRFERFNNEIKQGAKLIVRPGQMAVFVNEGQVADVFQEGTYELYTRNLPILSTLKAWSYGFNSPFKAEVYFFSTRNFTNLKWGTQNPIILRDAEFGSVRVRAFGSYAMKVKDPQNMLQNLVSTDGLFKVNEISNQIRAEIVSSFTAWLGKTKLPLLDLASQYRDLGAKIRTDIQPDIDRYGLELTQLVIENVSLPPELEAVLDKRISMGILGDMNQYTQYQAANAIEAAANNPRGSHPAMDWGMGLAMGQRLASSLGSVSPPQAPQQASPVTPTTPPPPPAAELWHVSRNGQSFGPFPLEQLLQQGLTPDTYVWKAGMTAWVKAAEVPELARRLSMMPPPPPPA
jgi:membrane protease subunit (stomatin/prohibitin family)